MRSTHSRRRPQRRPSIYGRRQAPGCKRTRLTVQDGGRAPVRAPVCLSSPACHPDTEGGTHSSTGAIICHREGGGGGVGAAASSRLQILASQSKMAAHTPSRALVCRWGHVCCPCLCLNQISRAVRRQQSLTLTLTLTLTRPPNPSPKNPKHIHRELVSTDR